MKNDERMPASRKNDLLVTRLESGETVVYDLKRDVAHCLNPTVAEIWKCCDGRMAVSEAAQMAAERHGSPDDNDVVLLGLAQLRRNHLLEDEAPELGARLAATSRRELMRRLGMAAAVSLPVVLSITAPTPAAAASCLQSGDDCTSGYQCCSNQCVGGKCL